MKRTAPPVHRVTAGELGALVGASEDGLLRAAELGVLKLAGLGGRVMGFHIESSFWVTEDEVEPLKVAIQDLRCRGVLL
jgi:hypothetical protein